MTKSLEDEIQRIVARMDEVQENQEQDLPGTTAQETERETNTQTPPDELHEVYVLIVQEREEEENEAQVVDSTLDLPQNISLLPAYAICCCYVLLIVSTVAFQLYRLFNPPIATITIIAKSQNVTLSGTLHLGRILPPLTLSQSQTVRTTGKGHQDARSATGLITFYNGLFTAQTIQAGTILTGADGIQVITDQDAVIPAANPPNLGQTMVPAHVTQTGGIGNIPAFDVDTSCCLTAVKAVNPQPFSGGADERDFQTVAKSDVDTTAAPLKTAIIQSMQGAFSSQLTPQEQVQLLPCTPTQTVDHQPGQEATHVTVTVSASCSAVAYHTDEFHAQATALLTTQATQLGGAGYTLVGAIHVTIRQAIVAHRAPTLVFSCQGEWVYGVTKAQQQVIKSLLAGKTKQQALQTLAHLPGIVKVAIGDVDDTTRLPSNPGLIHLVILEQPG